MRRLFACFLVVALPVMAVTNALAQDQAPVRVFDAGQLAPSQYTVVERIWTGTWRAPFWLPGYDDAGAAVAALTNKAASLDANGVVNLYCVNDARGWGGGYLCYGLAVKLK
jgi:hypothetical protein